VIWIQATRSAGGCFGSRICPIVNHDFPTITGDRRWNLYRVSEQEGRNSTFLKFVVTVRDQDSLPYSWAHLRTLRPHRIVDDIGNEFGHILPRPGFLHFQVGLDVGVVRTGLDTHEALDEHYDGAREAEIDKYYEREYEEVAEMSAIDKLIDQQLEEDYYERECEEVAEMLAIDKLIDQQLEEECHEKQYEEVAEMLAIDKLIDQHLEEEYHEKQYEEVAEMLAIGKLIDQRLEEECY